MSRLPVPGQDSGTWGDVLNDYLSQAHAADGTIKPGVVGSSQLAAGAVTSTQLAADAVTATTIANGTITEAQLDTTLQTKIDSSAADATTASKGLIQLAGDLGGTATSPQVAKIQGIAVSGTPTVGQVLTASSGTAASWATLPTVPLSSLFQPMTSLYPASDITTAALTTSGQTFTNQSSRRWDSGCVNSQGQKWINFSASDPSLGCLNDTTGRRISGTTIQASVIDFSFITTHSQFDVQFLGGGSGVHVDCQVYAEYQGKMCKLTAQPLSLNPASFASFFLNVKFASEGIRRIRVVFGVAGSLCSFMNVIVEASTIVTPGPTLPLFIADGDSYFDASGVYNSGDVRGSYVVGSTISKIVEATGWACWRAGQGGTGWFNNGDNTNSSAVGSNLTSQFCSTQRVAQVAPALAAKPITYLIEGTINDLSFGQNAAATQTQVAAGLNRLVAADPHLPIVVVGPEPVTAPSMSLPVVGDAVDLNQQGIAAAAASNANVVGYINPHNIAAGASGCWFYGTAINQTPTGTTDQQGPIIGADTVHPNYYGHQYYGERIVAAMSQMRIPASRAYGLS